MSNILKRCPKCKESKRYICFRKNKYRKDNHDTYCKFCRSKIDKLRYFKNPEKWKSYQKKRYAKNPTIEKYNKVQYLKRKKSGKKRISDINRRARKKNASGVITKKIIKELLNEAKGYCFYCRKKLIKYHIDHFVPLCKSGSNQKSNLRISCPKCNLSKGSKIL